MPPARFVHHVSKSHFDFLDGKKRYKFLVPDWNHLSARKYQVYRAIVLFITCLPFYMVCGASIVNTRSEPGVDLNLIILVYSSAQGRVTS